MWRPTPPVLPPPIMVTSHSRVALGDDLPTHTGGSAAASAAWPLTNLAIFVPFSLSKSSLFTKMFVINGTAVSGNIDTGIYDSAGNLIVSQGTTVQSGTSAMQELDIANTRIQGPGVFYLALACSNTTSTFFCHVPAINANRVLGLMEMASAFPLPATATFAAINRAYVPIVGASLRTLAA